MAKQEPGFRGGLPRETVTATVVGGSDDFGSAGSKKFTFVDANGNPIVVDAGAVQKKSSGSQVYDVKFNTDTTLTGTNACDLTLVSQGDTVDPPGPFTSVTIYSSAAAVKDTDFTITGWV